MKLGYSDNWFNNVLLKSKTLKIYYKAYILYKYYKVCHCPKNDAKKIIKYKKNLNSFIKIIKNLTSCKTFSVEWWDEVENDDSPRWKDGRELFSFFLF
jgi:hypothetical protein